MIARENRTNFSRDLAVEWSNFVEESRKVLEALGINWSSKVKVAITESASLSWSSMQAGPTLSVNLRAWLSAFDAYWVWDSHGRQDWWNVDRTKWRPPRLNADINSLKLGHPASDVVLVVPYMSDVEVAKYAVVVLQLDLAVGVLLT